MLNIELTIFLKLAFPISDCRISKIHSLSRTDIDFVCQVFSFKICWSSVAFRQTKILKYLLGVVKWRAAGVFVCLFTHKCVLYIDVCLCICAFVRLCIMLVCKTLSVLACARLLSCHPLLGVSATTKSKEL